MKKTLSKLLISVLIVLIISNYCMPNLVYANTLDAFKVANAAWGVVVEAIEDILGTIVGIFAIIPKAFVLPLALSAQSFMATIAYSQGVSDAEGNIKNATILNADTWFLTPFDIIFNKVALVDVNIFNIPSTAGAIKSIREAAAGWYYVMRLIAAAILLCVLIYVGIRMALTTVASDKAAYKKMLVDWITSLALIFLLQYIIVFTFAINTAFINALASVSKTEGISTAILKLYGSAMLLDIDSIAATIVICMLTWQTISLLIAYITRMLKVTFLVIISPLITLTYSIDKMGDGKAQALNTWLKEFIYTVLLQPFHCVIYVVFIGIALGLLGNPIFDWDNNNIGAAVLCILCIHFTKEAEKILGKIFNFSDSTSGASLATGMVAAAALASNAKNLGKGARNIANGIKNSRETISNFAITAGTARGILKGKTVEQARDDATASVHKFNDKIDSSMSSMKSGIKNAANTVVSGTVGAAFAKSMTARSNSKAVHERAKKLQEENNTLTYAQAKRKARAEIVGETREEKKKNNKEKTTENKRRIKEAVSYWKNSETGKQVKDVIPSMISMGAGIFVGAGSFGVGGSAMQSIMLGTATSKGTNEFFKTSTNRLATEGAELMKGAGVTTREDAKDYVGSIAGREDKLKDISKELDNIYTQILDSLNDLDKNEQNQVKGSIKNVVEKSLLSNPTASNEDIMNALQGNSIISGALDKSGKKVADFSATFSEGINLQRDSKIYQNLANARDWGLKPGVMMDDMIKPFTNGNPTVETYEGNKSPQEVEEIDISDVNIKEIQEAITSIDDLPQDIKEEINQMIQKKIDDAKLDMSNSSTQNTAQASMQQREIEVSLEKQQELAKKVLEDEVIIKKLTERSVNLENVIKKLRRARGG